MGYQIPRWTNAHGRRTKHYGACSLLLSSDPPLILSRDERFVDDGNRPTQHHCTSFQSASHLHVLPPLGAEGETARALVGARLLAEAGLVAAKHDAPESKGSHKGAADKTEQKARLVRPAVFAPAIEGG